MLIQLVNLIEFLKKEETIIITRQSNISLLPNWGLTINDFILFFYYLIPSLFLVFVFSRVFIIFFCCFVYMKLMCVILLVVFNFYIKLGARTCVELWTCEINLKITS